MKRERYEDGAWIPEMHPDTTINNQVIIGALCAKLDTARQALAGALEMNVVTPAAVSMKERVRWAMEETSPDALVEVSANCG